MSNKQILKGMEASVRARLWINRAANAAGHGQKHMGRHMEGTRFRFPIDYTKWEELGMTSIFPEEQEQSWIPRAAIPERGGPIHERSDLTVAGKGFAAEV
jgi:hypothetical protein